MLARVDPDDAVVNSVGNVLLPLQVDPHRLAAYFRDEGLNRVGVEGGRKEANLQIQLAARKDVVDSLNPLNVVLLSELVGFVEYEELAASRVDLLLLHELMDYRHRPDEHVNIVVLEPIEDRLRGVAPDKEGRLDGRSIEVGGKGGERVVSLFR